MKLAYYILAAVGVLVLSIMAFGQEKEDPVRERTIEKGVALKIEAFRTKKTRDCEEKALKRAVEVADSLIRVLAFEMNVSHEVGDKPLKPEKPEFKALRDSLSLDPLFQKDSTR